MNLTIIKIQFNPLSAAIIPMQGKGRGSLHECCCFQTTPSSNATQSTIPGPRGCLSLDLLIRSLIRGISRGANHSGQQLTPIWRFRRFVVVVLESSGVSPELRNVVFVPGFHRIPLVLKPILKRFRPIPAIGQHGLFVQSLVEECPIVAPRFEHVILKSRIIVPCILELLIKSPSTFLKLGHRIRFVLRTRFLRKCVT